MSGAAPQQQKLCAFCGGDAAAHGGRLGRMEGPYNASKNGYEAVYVHHACAVWSPKVSNTRDCPALSPGTARLVCQPRLGEHCSLGRSHWYTVCTVATQLQMLPRPWQCRTASAI